MGRPSNSMLPEVGGARPISIRIVVVLPAPLGPRNPKKQPRGTSRSSPSTAALVPYTLRRLRVRIAAGVSIKLSPMVQNGCGKAGLYSQAFLRKADSASVTAPATPLAVRERALRALGQLPPFSTILNRLIASLASEDVSFAKIADLIEKDTVLAGNILRLVNSALYGLPRTVNSILHAVSLLGINKLRNAALSMSVSRMWNQIKTPPGWSMARFNLHSVGVGILSDLLAQRMDVPYGEGAFAAGLFHDLGLLLVAIGLHDEYQQMARLCAADQKR